MLTGRARDQQTVRVVVCRVEETRLADCRNYHRPTNRDAGLV